MKRILFVWFNTVQETTTRLASNAGGKAVEGADVPWSSTIAAVSKRQDVALGCLDEAGVDGDGARLI